MDTQQLLNSAIVYDLEQEGNTEDIGFFCDYLRQVRGPVLELGCGTGRLAMPIAEPGNNIVGLDISVEMIKRFKEKLKYLPLETRKRIRVVKGNMRAFSLKETFQAAICSSNTFFLLESEEAVSESLNCVHAHLVPGGRLLIDFNAVSEETRSALARYPLDDTPDITVDLGQNGQRLTRTHSIKSLSVRSERRKPDLAERRFGVSYKYMDGLGRVCAKRQENVILLTPVEILRIISENGFEIAEKFGGYDRRPFTGTESRLIIAARKKE